MWHLRVGVLLCESLHVCRCARVSEHECGGAPEGKHVRERVGLCVYVNVCEQARVREGRVSMCALWILGLVWGPFCSFSGVTAPASGSVGWLGPHHIH